MIHRRAWTYKPNCPGGQSAKSFAGNGWDRAVPLQWGPCLCHPNAKYFNGTSDFSVVNPTNAAGFRVGYPPEPLPAGKVEFDTVKAHHDLMRYGGGGASAGAALPGPTGGCFPNGIGLQGALAILAVRMG